MPEPRSYPCVRYWEDGRFVLVETPLDYAHLEPGHADNPSGPFPAPVPAVPQQEPEVVALGERIRKLYVAGRSQDTIARTLGVTRSRVRKALNEPGEP